MSDFIVKPTPGIESDFNPSGTDLIATDVESAIKELAATVGVSASPGFSFGRSGNNSNGTWLLVTGSVPSNRAGITVALSNPVITQVFIANENINTFDITIFEHEGDEINLTSLGTVSVVASRSATFDVNFPLTSGRQLAVQITSGSARNVNVGLQLQGSV